MTMRIMTVCLVCVSVVLGACKQDPYNIVERPEAGVAPDGQGPGDGQGQAGDSRVDRGDGIKKDTQCVPDPAGEVCDGQDNDCNGIIDDVDPAKLATDVKNCGTCGHACSFINAFAKCVAGGCLIDSCAPGHWDLNKDPTDGCEYKCLVTNGGSEACPPAQPDCACDNLDNDCNGLVDEVFDKTSDVNNCGGCGQKCLYTHAKGVCTNSSCKMGDCEPGYADLNKNADDGCEYKCPVWPAVAEQCNGLDDNCDGQIDEDLTMGTLCNTGLLGECAAGSTRCLGGKLSCNALAAASPEVCDGKDNDCDGQIDEDFNLPSNPLNCGICGKVCSFPNAKPQCDQGVCKLESCLPGYRDLNGDPKDGCEKKCDVWPPSAEKCNGVDDDCNGLVDEGFDLKTDPDHCGACTTKCTYANATAQCLNSACVMGPCAANYYDNNKDPSDGCEYACIKSNGGVEVCDNVDNDCDGVIDNGFDKQTDLKNCGTCGNACAFANAPASCVAGKCVMGACTAGFKDLNGSDADGCEYKCPIWPPAAGPDTCDGVDNNCNGKIDEDFTSGPCGSSVGECKQGTSTCQNGQVFCQGALGSKVEICDGLDNDCDGVIDNGFNKQSDPRYCGGCTACALPHAIANCTNGVCGIAVCEVGWVDLDKNPATGCEYTCAVTGVEICDGLDNDCNGKTDTADPGMVPLGGNPCATTGACANASATCQGNLGWVCNYGPDVELLPCTSSAECGNSSCVGNVCVGLVATDESRCDGKDNDCDGKVDEPFTNKGQACGEPNKKGICQGTGSYVCNPAGTATECKITAPGKAATDELCNGLDDDCDGLVDEGTDDAAGKGVHDPMVHVQRTVSGTSYNYYIYSYEASRPDATATDDGTLGSRACSKPGVLPWSNVTYTEAAAACGVSGKRLCTKNEWVIACQGASGTLYPYGATYQPAACNGYDRGLGAPAPTGSLATCQGGETGLFDMSGNVREWTSEKANILPVPPVPFYVVRGGAYHTPVAGLTCTFDLSLAVENVPLPAIGFRCCSDTPP